MGDAFQPFSDGGNAAIPLAAALQFKDAVIEVVNTVLIRIDSENSAVLRKTDHRVGDGPPDNVVRQQCLLLYFVVDVFVKNASGMWRRRNT